MARTDWHRIRVLAVAGLVVFAPVCGILIWAVMPIWFLIAEAENDSNSIRQLRELAAEKPLFRIGLVRAQTNLVVAGVLYSDNTPELASAQLQNTLQGLVGRAGGQIQSTSIDAPQSAHGLEVLGVTLSFTLPASQLASFLTSIDLQKPYLVVQGIDVRSSDYGNGTEPLDVQLQVNGFSGAQ